jgi:hypothetical protein
MCAGFDHKAVARVLDARGYLEHNEKNRLDKKTRVPELGNVRVYVIKASIMDQTVAPVSASAGPAHALGNSGDTGDGGAKSLNALFPADNPGAAQPSGDNGDVRGLSTIDVSPSVPARHIADGDTNLMSQPLYLQTSSMAVPVVPSVPVAQPLNDIVPPTMSPDVSGEIDELLRCA